eukprot:TRINITY_DN5995_c0_g1_i5.p1 TRINITY_DN5995_c0_g1~~TRINITY_DN5995_c0_g1_i5.p1  ORF type:complete len:277 (-),score=54.85 TRINITY_DN5995_c0_g1_i5:137-886(-)
MFFLPWMPFLLHVWFVNIPRRAQCMLNMLWELYSSSNQKLHVVYEVQPLIHRCRLLQYEMRNFISNLISFVHYNGMERAWKRLKSRFILVNNFDSVMELYLDFVHSIYCTTFNQDEDKQRTEIFNIFSVVIRFCKEQKELISSALQVASFRQSLSLVDGLTLRDDLLEDNSDEGAETEVEKTFRSNLNHTHVNQFNRNCKDFRLALSRLGMFSHKEDSSVCIEGLEQLARQVDYNSYYSKKKKYMSPLS